MTGVQTCALPICFPVTIQSVVGLKDLVRLQQALNLEAAQVSEVIKEVTGKDRSGDCTKPELALILQALKDKYGNGK